MQTKTQPDLVRIYPLQKTCIGYMHKKLVPIENTKGNLGLLIGEGPEMDTLENALYIRAGKQKEISVHRKVSFGLWKDTFYAAADGKVLPLPSMIRYTICEITEKEHDILKGSFSREDFKNGIEYAISILSDRTDLSSKKNGIIFGSSRLVTPKGYADQLLMWQLMNSSH